MSVLTAINNNKTKVLGIATVVLGFIQGYPGLPDLLGKNAYAWAMFLIGVGVTICGFLNSNPNTAPSNNGSSGSGLRMLALLFLVISFGTVTLGVSGCSGTRAAYSEADSLPDRAYVLLEQYFAVLKEWREVVTDPATPEEAKKVLRDVELHATPVFIGDDGATPPRPSLRSLAGLYQSAPNAQTAIQLQDAVNAAVRSFTELSNAVKAARSDKP